MVLIANNINRGPVNVLSHSGTIQRALNILSSEVDCPLIGSSKLRNQIKIYNEFGYNITDLVEDSSAEGKKCIKNGRYIRFFGKGDRRPIDFSDEVTIKLSAYFTRRDTPVTEYSKRSFGVALSNHADFNGTLDYVKETGADFVLTDNSRGGKAIDLALAINKMLNVDALPSEQTYSYEWGRK
ncbi:MAG: hypothetical protein IH840_05285 [Candidatus Heimdallarchaeota archaeon]|nr:hypothetical protein [Candidatus Heimdallarchaeota archaeon]